MDIIADKVVNKLVTNDNLRLELSNYILKSMMSNININSTENIPTSALVYTMQELLSNIDKSIININNSISNIKNDYIRGYSGINPPSLGNATQGPCPAIVLACINSGIKLSPDPEFSSGSNNISIYSNSTYSPKMIRELNTTSGNSSGYLIKFTHEQESSPGLGGFYQKITSKENGCFVQIFRAKLPKGYHFAPQQNIVGVNGYSTFYTSPYGTGKWEWYIRFLYCGYPYPDYAFGTSGHVSIHVVDGTPNPTPSNPLIWYLASCQSYHITLT